MEPARSPSRRSTSLRLLGRTVAVALAVLMLAACAGVFGPGLGGGANTKARWASGDGGPRLVVQTAHTGKVNALAFTPNGGLLATASSDLNVKLWDVASGQEVRAFTGHSDDVLCVAFAPSGDLMASGGRDRTVRLWEVTTGTTVAEVKSNSDRVNALAFDPAGKSLATGAGDGTVRFFDAETGEETMTLGPVNGAVLTLAFAPDGASVAVGTSAGSIVLFSLPDGKTQVLDGHAGAVYGIAYAPDGKTLVSGGADSTMRTWSTVDGAEVRSVDQGQPIGAVVFSPDGSLLATGLFDDSITLWHPGEEGKVGSLTGDFERVRSLAFNADGTILASAPSSGPVTFWDVALMSEVQTLKGGVLDTTSSVATSADKKLFALGSAKVIRVWNLETGALIHTLRGHKAPIRALAFSRDGTTLISGSDDRTARVWRLDTGKSIHVFKGHHESISTLDISPDGKVVASAGDDKVIKLWSPTSGAELATLTGHGFWINAVRFNHAGTRLVSGSDDSMIKIWDVAEGRIVRSLSGHSSDVESVAFSPDDTVIVSASRDGSVRLWDANTGAELRRLDGHHGAVLAVDFIDADHLVSAGSDGTLRVWSLSEAAEAERDADSYEPAVIHAHPDAIDALVLGPRGTIVSAGAEGLVRLWEPDGGLAATLRAIDDDDWVVSRPDGRYDGTPDGIRRMHYVQGDTPITLEALAEPLLTPGLVASVARGDHLEPVLDVRKGIPPPPVTSIALEGGEPRTKKAGAEVRILVEAEDSGTGVREVRAFHNGVRLAEETAPSTVDPGHHVFQSRLIRGDNVFRATAFNSAMVASKPSEMKLERRAKRHKAKLYVIAVSDEADGSAVAIALTLARKAKKLFKKVVVQELVAADATPDKVRAAMATTAESATSDDVFVFVLSGAVAELDRAQGKELAFALGSTATDPTNLARSGLRGGDLVAMISRVPAIHRLVLLDTSGKADHPARVRRQILSLARAAGGDLMAVTSSEGEFADLLVHGFEGLADGRYRRDRRVSVRELSAFVTAAMAKSKHLGRLISVSDSSHDFALTRR